MSSKGIMDLNLCTYKRYTSYVHYAMHCQKVPPHERHRMCSQCSANSTCSKFGMYKQREYGIDRVIKVNECLSVNFKYYTCSYIWIKTC